MARKPKDIYTRIKEKESQIIKIKQRLSVYEDELLQLNKERETIEMNEIFKTAKENGLSCKEVIEMISKVHKRT